MLRGWVPGSCRARWAALHDARGEVPGWREGLMGRPCERLRAIAEGRLEEFRRKRRDEKRRHRAQLRAKGLNGEGRPMVRPDLSVIGRIAHGTLHPSDCLCYDCLWGASDARVAAEAPVRRGRVGIPVARRHTGT